MLVENGAYVEITKNINAIPKGIYRVVETNDWHVSFQVGDCIFFSVSHHAIKWIQALPKTTQKITTQREFLEKYYALLDHIETQNNAVFEKGKPFTHCIISPSVAREEH